MIARAVGVLRRNWLFAVFLTFGVLLRLVTWFAYRPALLYIDSFRYLDNLEALRPDQLNPTGYDIVLQPLTGLGGLHAVAGVQHLLGLVIAVGITGLARRLRARRWIAALAALPILLDGYQLQIEQSVMSEVWFQAALLAVLWLLCAWGPAGWVRALAVGLLLGAAVLLRLIGISVAVPVLVYLVVAGGALRVRAWRQVALRVVALVVGLAVVLVPYAAYFRSFTGRWGLTISSGNVLYGRTAQVADCDKLSLDTVLAQFCPPEPLGQRLGIDFYAHADGDPNWPGPLPAGSDREMLAHEFAQRVLAAQPFDVLGAVLRDFAKAFAPVRVTFDDDVPVQRWQFQHYYPLYEGFPDPTPYTQRFDGEFPAVYTGLTAFLRGYQLSVGYTPGTLLGIAGLLGVGGAVGFRRARRSGLRGASFVIVGSALVLTLGSAAFEFSWRYQLPGLVLFPLAGAVGWTALRAPHPDPARPDAPEPDALEPDASGPDAPGPDAPEADAPRPDASEADEPEQAPSAPGGTAQSTSTGSASTP